MMSEDKASQKMLVSSLHPEALTELDELAAAYFRASNDVNAQGRVSRVATVVLEVTVPRELEESVQRLDQQLRQETSRLQLLTDVTTLLSSNWDVGRFFRGFPRAFAACCIRSLPPLRCITPGPDFSCIRRLTFL
jgi:hypothetical protein